MPAAPAPVEERRAKASPGWRGAPVPRNTLRLAVGMVEGPAEGVSASMGELVPRPFIRNCRRSIRAWLGVCGGTMVAGVVGFRGAGLVGVAQDRWCKHLEGADGPWLHIGPEIGASRPATPTGAKPSSPTPDNCEIQGARSRAQAIVRTGPQDGRRWIRPADPLTPQAGQASRGILKPLPGEHLASRAHLALRGALPLGAMKLPRHLEPSGVTPSCECILSRRGWADDWAKRRLGDGMTIFLPCTRHQECPLRRRTRLAHAAPFLTRK